ncbi:class II aldolase/adducin family protein [Alicyclobacillus suci]|uniref:class II aldolase/adducin family protein n=1 Tax=Alicyclobacillus suci TaxID=2816080 RepID=UPI001A8C7D3B|nr:class II aldolase/adducin family protein [Alicyclobacillus suci]
MSEAISVNQEVVQELREKIATGCRILAKLELSDYLGHVSARVPGTDYVLIKARGLVVGNLLDMTPDKVVMVNMEGEMVDGDYRQPDEVVLHTEIFKKRPDVMSVVHTHQPITTVFGDQNKKILPMQGVMADVLRKDIPTYYSSRKVVAHEQGAEVADILGDSDVIHLKNHGVVTVGESVEQAVIRAIWLEHQAKLTLLGSILGEPQGMSQKELEQQRSDAGPIDGRWMYYKGLLGE